MSKILDIQDVSAKYDHDLVLKEASLSVDSNDFIGFIGPNGGGKSTLLKLILGLIEPCSGRIKYFRNGAEVGFLNMGYLAQKSENEYKFPITAYDIVLSGLYGGDKGFRIRPGKKEKQQVNKVLDEVGISELRKANISELSGGQAQKVMLSRAIVSNPELLLLDEPNTFLDSSASNNLYSLLKELNERMAIILVSHDIGTISPYIKTIACINLNLHYHQSNKLSSEVLASYNCPIELITHGHVPHRVLHDHS